MTIRQPFGFFLLLLDGYQAVTQGKNTYYMHNILQTIIFLRDFESL